MAKPKIKSVSSKSKNKDGRGRERNYEFVVDYDKPVKPKRNK